VSKRAGPALAKVETGGGESVGGNGAPKLGEVLFGSRLSMERQSQSRYRPDEKAAGKIYSLHHPALTNGPSINTTRSWLGEQGGEKCCRSGRRNADEMTTSQVAKRGYKYSVTAGAGDAGNDGRTEA